MHYQDGHIWITRFFGNPHLKNEITYLTPEIIFFGLDVLSAVNPFPGNP